MKITKETYFHALALYMLARRKQAEVEALETKMNSLLGEENGSHASDAIYNSRNSGSQEEFDIVIKKIGVSEDDNPSTCNNCGGKDWHHSVECYLGK